MWAWDPAHVWALAWPAFQRLQRAQMASLGSSRRGGKKPRSYTENINRQKAMTEVYLALARRDVDVSKAAEVGVSNEWQADHWTEWTKAR